MAGRPRSFDRDAALEAAVEQFWRHGYAETSISRLTEAMGISPPSLYAAFGDKDALFTEASSTYFDRTSEAVALACERPTAREAIERILDDTARAHTRDEAPPGCLMLTEPRLTDQRRTLRGQLRERLARGVRDGDLPPGTDCDQLATFLVAVLRGMSGCARDGGTAADLAAIATVARAVLPSVS